jgi:hypothetical protein
METSFEKDIDMLLAYIISSAAGCVSEPKIYGPFRLIDTAERMIRLLDRHGMIKDEALRGLADKIEREKLTCMGNQGAFVSMLDDASARMADIVSLW